MAKKDNLSFYDLGAKKKFSTADYKIVDRNNRRFAVAKNAKGKECWRAMGKK